MSRVFEPQRGVKVWRNKKGMLVFRLHWSADPAHDAEWGKKQAAGMDEAYARQELEIDFFATSGQRLYHMNEEWTLEDPITIPEHWTRYYVLDPARGKPHASLWAAVDPDDFVHIYREYWPSKVYGLSSAVPDDDTRISVPQYVECVAWLESKENPQNNGKAEKIYDRILDTFARALKASNQVGASSVQDEINFQDLFEEAGDTLSDKYPGFEFRFADAIKDHKDLSIEMVNELLQPREILKKDGSGYEKRSKVLVSRDCVELIWQLKNNRRAQQSAHQRETADPEVKKLNKKNDLTDCLCYLIRHEPQYVKQDASSRQSTWSPAYEGIGY